MPLSAISVSDKSEDLQALRRLIEEVARQYRIDLLDRSVIARIMDGDKAIVQATGIEPELYEDLSSMLRLLVRIECSSSEDLGVSGMCRLWERHREFLRRFGPGTRAFRLLPVAC